MRNIDAAAVEAAGTWFGALVSLGAVVTAARLFLSDKLFQDYQLAADREREREEQAERDRSLLAQARESTSTYPSLGLVSTPTETGTTLRSTSRSRNNSAHRITHCVRQGLPVTPHFLRHH